MEVARKSAREVRCARASGSTRPTGAPAGRKGSVQYEVELTELGDFVDYVHDSATGSLVAVSDAPPSPDMTLLGGSLATGRTYIRARRSNIDSRPLSRAHLD